MKIWIKFLQSYKQKGKNGASDTEFKEGDVVQIEESVAKSLVELGFAEKTEAPNDDGSLEPILKTFSTKVESTIESVITNAIANINKKLEAPNFASPKDPNSLEEWGFKSPEHFWKCVHAVAIKNSNFPGVDFLTKAPSGQNISNDPEGGFLVPEPIADRIWSNLMEEPASILPQTLQMTTAGNSMKVPTFFEASRKTGTGNRNGGIVAYWVDEAGTLTASQFTTGRTNLELHKLAALCYATSEMLEDSGFSITGFINQLAPRAINFEVANALINGTGVGKPQGVLRSDALIVVPATTRTGTLGQNELGHYMLSSMYWRNINRDRATWYVHPATAQFLEFVYFDDDSTTRNPVYSPANVSGSLTQTPFATLYGRPVVPYEFMPAPNQEGDLAFIDWSDYATLQKSNGGIKFANSIHVRFLNDEVAFRFTFRIDGRALWTAAKEDLNGTITRSPYVAAAKRTGGASSSGL